MIVLVHMSTAVIQEQVRASARVMQQVTPPRKYVVNRLRLMATDDTQLHK